MGNSGQRSEQSRTARNNNQHAQRGAAVAIVVKAVFLVQLRFGFSEREDEKTQGMHPSAVRTGRQSRVRVMIRAVSTCVLVLASAGICALAHAQGMATGGTAVPARPLPPGMKPPVVQYQDIAARAGLTGVNISAAARHEQF